MILLSIERAMVGCRWLLCIFFASNMLSWGAIQNVVGQQTSQSPRLDWIDQLFEKRESRGVAGAVCAVVENDRVVHLNGYGVENRKTQRPIDPSTTRFYLASVTKAITATAIMRLVDRGMVDLDTDINEYLGSTPNISTIENSELITLRHLLTHTAGFDDRNIGMAAPTRDQLKSLSKYLAGAMPPQIRPAGEITMYDNHGWALAGLVAERVTEQSFDKLLTNEVFKPLGMAGADTHNSIDYADRQNFAKGYTTRREQGQLVWKEILLSYRQTSPAGNVWATADDITRFMRMHLNMGKINGTKYFSSATAQNMQTTCWTPVSGAEGLTPGFWERRVNGHRVLMIMGAGPEGAAIIALVPEKKWGAYLAISRQDLSYLIPIFQKILERMVPGEPDKFSNQVLPDWDRRAKQLPGEYFLLRFGEKTMETLAKWGAWVRVEVVEPGQIRTIDSSGAERVYHEVSPNVFRQTGKPGYIAFKTSSDGQTIWATTTDGLGFGDGMGFPNSFQKAKWFERVSVKRSILLVSLSLFLLTIVGWPIASLLSWILRRLWRKKEKTPAADRLRHPWPIQHGRWLIGATALCGLLGISGVAMLLGDKDRLVIGLPNWAIVPFGLLLVFILLSLLSVVITGIAWKRLAWTWRERIYATCFSAITLILIPFLWNWNLIGWPTG